MARNEEKAQSILSRFRAQKKLELEGEKERRPFLASECDSVRECERWRKQVIHEVAKGIAEIQNAGLGEFRIRDLNDEINKRLREKRHWEDRIRELGGPDYKKTGPKMLDHEGKEVPGSRGYKYFGAARDLPGVRELLVSEVPSTKKKTRGELLKRVDADYYGYRDEEDGVLVPREAAAEAAARRDAEAAWRAKHGHGGGAAMEVEGDVDGDEVEYYQGGTEPADDLDGPLDGGLAGGLDGDVHVDVPSQDDIAALLLARRKQLLLAEYASEEMQAEQQATMELVGRT
mmetsp:Transcript_26690/g.70161  ORF Transcript_26690/g.70161 Transcript_26690/m.70161 type:complete len:288 (+) Transcript_26690:135-998(+)